LKILGSYLDQGPINCSPNSGGWYDFGFLLGVGMWAGGGYAAKKKRQDW